jgi:hypothetical protein
MAVRFEAGRAPEQRESHPISMARFMEISRQFFFRPADEFADPGKGPAPLTQNGNCWYLFAALCDQADLCAAPGL